MSTYGTDSVGLGQFDGDITTDKGVPIISTNSDGELATLIGSAPLRSIHTGITNGDFAALPDDPDTDISDDNALPYFNWDNTSGTAFRAVIASDNSFVNGNRVVRVLVGTAIATGTATLTRIEPIGATGGVGNAFVPFITASKNTVAGSGVTVGVFYEFLAVDQSTVLGTAVISAEQSWETVAGLDGLPQPIYGTFLGDPEASVYNAAPAGAEFVKVIVKFACTAAGGSGEYVVGERSIDIVDIGFERGSSTIYLNENDEVGTFAPGSIEQSNGTMKIASGLGTPPGAENAAIYVGVEDPTYPQYGQIVLDANSGTINLLAALGVTTDVDLTVGRDLTVARNITSSSTNTITGDKFRATSTTDASLSSTGHAFQIGASSGQNLRIDSNEIMVVNNGGTATLLLQNDGGLTRAGDGFAVTGNIDATGSIASEDLIQALGVFRTIQAATTDTAFTARVTSEGTPRFAIFCNGVMEWGGGGTRDLNLYRSGANALTTSGELNIGGGNATISSSGAFLGTNISLSGTNGLRHDEPATTTQTSSAAIWVTVSGTNRQLRRNSSSARYKTNIVDADEVVLDAARKVKPRHYESTIKDENGATRLGFIAEEVHDAGLTHAVGYDSEGKPETIDSVALIAALWHRVDALESRLAELEKAR